MKKTFLQMAACLALVATSISTYGWCFWLIYQEELPEGAKQVLRGKKK